ncbi:hemolysin-III related-domain-containing protein [Lasiosphaeria ovina]|uniref:Hemolysin-III related-domain-containing protein n=1 Tax=Lasiosphaeria ovina TaxID=92902 RepID=A0AAE0KAL8_9PEZI|nr:hemolysin-III related-domain-containing protein [Lasiosphaeria ovina]
MAPVKRSPASSLRGHSRTDSSSPHRGQHKADSSTMADKNRLLSHKQVPSWHSEPFIHGGYRPITESAAFCLRSLTYLHNETVNIFSHLVPAAVALALACLVPWYFGAQFPRAAAADRLVFQLYLLGSVCCFAASALFHTLLCHSERYRDLWVRVDYAAILAQTLGCFVSGIYFSFYCEPHLQRLYWAMIGTLTSLSAFVVLNPRFQSREWRQLRVGSFVATGLSAFAPIIHAAVIFPYAQLDQQAGLRYYYLEGVLLLVGTFHYMSHLPEAWRPGAFDIWGSSHQVFHVLVVLSALVHLCGILSAFRWNYENPRCPSPHAAWGLGDF